MTMKRTCTPILLFILTSAVGCSGEGTPGENTNASGGTAVASGGATSVASGGTSMSSGGSGFQASTGGLGATTGGVGASGGQPGAGGTSTASGGVTGSTGGAASGGAETGGTNSGMSTGGDQATGGAPPDDDGPPAAPEGVIPNQAYPEDTVGLPKDRWQDGLISPTLESEHHNQPSVINGYLQITGNSRFSIYDISDPTDPQQRAHTLSPNDCTPCGEAEGHQVSFAKYGDRFFTVTIQGKGIDIWDITDVRNPEHVQGIDIQGINYGDFTEAVWGVAWQGSHIYVGGTNTGVHVVDASDPENASLVGRVANLGGVLAGPLFPVGNTLVVTTPKSNAGIATLDISDPETPILLDSLVESTESYIGGFYRHYAFLLNPIRVYDVLSSPTDIETVGGNRPGGYFEYVSFQDDMMFAGRIRPEPGANKIDVSDMSNMRTVGDILGRRNLSENDDQFTVAVGNLLVLSDDQLSPVTNEYAGTVIAVHDPQPDTTAPRVDTVAPHDGATGQAVTSRIGLSFTDNIELATVDHRSLIVRPMGGEPLAGKWGVNMSVLHFDPDEDLQSDTTYEIVLPAGGIKDYVGNGIAEEFRSTFRTK